MSDQRIPISQLSETQTAPDASYIAIDDGSLTKKITVENFNSTSTASAQQYANQAAASAQTVEDNIATSAAQIREATLAAREATQASTAATASAASAYDSASLAQNYSANASTSAGQAMNAADSVAQNVTVSKGYAEDSEAWAVGKRNGTDVPSSDDTYHNNAKYYSNSAAASATSAASDADRAEAAADSINLPDTTLVVSGVAAESKATGDSIRALFDSYKTVTVSGETVTIDDAAGGSPAKQLVVDIAPSQSGTGDPGPDNIRPINFYSGVTVERAGKNVIPFPYYNDTVTKNGITFTVESDGGITVSGTATATADFYIIRRKTDFPNGDFLINLKGNYTSSDSAYIHYVLNSGGSYSNVYVGSGDSAFTVSDNGFWDCVLRVPSGQTVSGTFYPMIRAASDTDDNYEPYDGKTYTVTFPEEAGLIYGGTLIVNSDGTGTLTVDKAYFNVSSVTTIGTPTTGTNGNRAGFAIPGVTIAADSADLICSCGQGDIAVNGASSGWVVGTCALYKGTTQTFWRYIFPTSITTGAAALQYLVDHNCEIVFQITEPIATYTFSEQEVVFMLKGKNNIWANTAGTSSITYYVDINETITEVEDIRVMADGTAATSAGDAVRTQVIGLDNKFDYLVDKATAPALIFSEVSGTYRIRMTCSLPAGVYKLTIDSVVSSDTDAAVSSIYFYYESSGSVHVDLERGVEIDQFIKFADTVNQIDFYASSNSAGSTDDTFTYTNFGLGRSLTDSALTAENVAADAKVTGNLLTAAGAVGDGASKVYGGNVFLSTPAGTYTAANGSFTLSKLGNVYKVDGTFASANTRIPLTGSQIIYSTSQPSYDRFPLWYVDDIPDFVVGHDYVMTYVADGETTAAEPTFTMRTKDGSYNQSYPMNTVFTCTVKPQMVCTILKPGEYTNYRIFITITDLTATGGRYYVPKIFESQLGTAITKIKTDINSTKTVGTYGTDIESFVFITDVHWAANKQHSPGLIKRIMEQTPISTVICGGDIIQSHAANKEAACAEIKDFTNVITQIPCNDYFTVFGNHDDNSNSNSGNISEMFTKAEQYNLLFSPFVNSANVHWIWEDVPAVFTEAVTKNDYYIDHSRTRTRFICLDWNNPVSANRSAWVSDILARNDGFRVVIIYHGFYSGENLTPEHDGWLSVFEPYKSKIVAMFTGHAHVDGVVDCYGDGSTPVIVTSCDTFRADRMTEGTLDEQCFDVAVIDYTNSVIKLTRIGRGSDRTVAFTLS